MTRLLALLTLLFALHGAAAWAGPNDDISPQERYELGLRLMKRGYYTKALEQFNRVRNFHRDDPVSVKAELAIADLYFKKGDYELARLSYEDFARLHPRHQDLDYVVYRIGLSIDKRASKLAGRDQTPTQQAVNTWTGFDTRFPESQFTDEVEHLLGRSRDRLALKELSIARFYARRGAWVAVRKRSERLLKKYPESRHAPAALWLRGEALHEWGLEEEAQETRERLAEAYPDSRYLHRLDHLLTTPPGEPAADEVFQRPYRVPSGLGLTGPAGGGE